MKSNIFLKYFIHDFVWKQFFTYNSPQAPTFRASEQLSFKKGLAG